MLTDLTTSVANISPEALDKLFAETPDNQVNADDLNVPSSNTKVIKDDKDSVFKVSKGTEFDVPEIDLDELEKQTEGKAEEGKKKESEEGQEGKEPKDKKKEDVVEDKKEEGKEPKEKKEDKKEGEPSKEEVEARNAFLKNSVDFLVEKGIFKDFEGREELEMTEEIFSKLLEKQIEAKVEDSYTSKKKSAGEFGEAVLEYIENGGDADKLIDLFKERKVVEDYDISDETSQEEIITKWYKEVHGWKPEKIKKYLDTLNAEEGLLEGEAEEIKGKYKESYTKQLQELRDQQDQYNKDQLRKQKAFETNITKAIETNKEFDDSRRKFIKNSIFKVKTLEDGTKVNDFYLKFAEWQKNPELYIELAEFIMDKEGYLKRKSVEVGNKAVKESFNFVKGNGTLSKNKGSKHVEREDTAEATGTDFSVIFK